jgi:hypothetical protein
MYTKRTNHILWILLLTFSSATAQVDTLALFNEVNGLITVDDHREYFIQLRHRDQSLRANNTSKINDLRNLVSVSYYINIHGYPDPDAYGQSSSIISIVWIHNSYPAIDKYTFPIILEGLKGEYIAEKEIRQYYLRSLYNRKHTDDLLQTKDLDAVYKDLDLNTSNRINISKILEAYNKSEAFLNADYEVIGVWHDWKGRHDISIFKDGNEQCYLHKHYTDGSHFPEKINQDKKFKTLYKRSEDAFNYYGLQKNGQLSIKDNLGKRLCNAVEIER